MEAFEEWLENQDEVVLVMALTDIMKRLNTSIHGNDPDWYRLPYSRERAVQYLLLPALLLWLDQQKICTRTCQLAV